MSFIGVWLYLKKVGSGCFLKHPAGEKSCPSCPLTLSLRCDTARQALPQERAWGIHVLSEDSLGTLCQPCDVAHVWSSAPSEFCSEVSNLVFRFLPHTAIPPLHKGTDAIFCMWNKDWSDRRQDTIQVLAVLCGCRVVTWPWPFVPQLHRSCREAGTYVVYLTASYESHKTLRLKGILCILLATSLQVWNYFLKSQKKNDFRGRL